MTTLNRMTSPGSANPDAPTDGTTYGGSHQPPEDGSPLHNLLLTGDMPTDVYRHPEYLTHSGTDYQYDRDSIAVVLAVRGLPDAPVTVYRAAPQGVTQFDAGNWVAISEAYARQHATRDDEPSHDWPVYSAIVPASAVRCGGNDLIEWGLWVTVPATRLA